MKVVIGHTADNHPVEIDAKELLISNLLVEGATRSGKSYAVRKLLELLATIIQIIIIDPEGELASLREKFDFLYAGPDELPMSIHTAGELASKLVETRASCICDLSELKVTDRKGWVRAFVESLMESPKNTWHNEKIVFIDEAHLFAPEKDKAESLAAVVDLAGRGQKRGFTLICATQRISKLSKDVISELQNTLVGRHTLDIDRERAAETLGVSKNKNVMAEFMAKIKVMPRGTFFALGSAISDEIVSFKVDKVVTTHPERGQKLTVPPPPSEKIRAVLERLKDLPQQVEKKLKNEADLREHIDTLERKIRDMEFGMEPEKVEVAVEIVREIAVPVLSDEQTAQIKGSVDSLFRLAELFNTGLKTLSNRPEISAPVRRQPIPANPPRHVFSDVHAAPYVGRSSSPAPQSNGDIPKGEIAVLKVIAMRNSGVYRDQITVMTGYKKSSRDTYIQRLRERGLIEQEGDRVKATKAGISALGNSYEPLPTGRRLQEFWLSRLPEGEKVILKILLDHHAQGGTSRDIIGERSGYKKSSRDTYIQRLSARRLIESGPDRGFIKASSELF